MADFEVFFQFLSFLSIPSHTTMFSPVITGVSRTNSIGQHVSVDWRPSSGPQELEYITWNVMFRNTMGSHWVVHC
jgi:hypothetical protein